MIKKNEQMNDPQTENYFFNKFIVIPFPVLLKSGNKNEFFEKVVLRWWIIHSFIVLSFNSFLINCFDLLKIIIMGLYTHKTAINYIHDIVQFVDLFNFVLFLQVC